MFRRARRSFVIISTGLAAALGPAAVAHARVVAPPGSPQAVTWTRLSVVESFADQVGMLRTSNGQLHLAWRVRLASGLFSYRAATVSAAGTVGATSTALSGWISLESDPRLIPGGPGIRLVFIGGRTTNPADFYSVGAVYTEVSSGGASWTLVHASMAQHTVLNLGLAAVARSATTPAAAFGLNNVLYYHSGLDPHAPATSPDGSVTGPVAVGLENVALARAKDGSIWMAWYEGGPKRGYWVDRILPAKGTPQRAPGSGTATSADNEPFQQVAFVARPAGGLYLAYCSPTAHTQCAHLSLWRVGATRALTVPGSGTGSAGRVAMSSAPGGRLWLAWYDFGSGRIRSVQTTTSASGFGAVATLRPPTPTFIFSALQADGSAGRLDLVVNITVLKPTGHPELWHIQIP